MLYDTRKDASDMLYRLQRHALPIKAHFRASLVQIGKLPARYHPNRYISRDAIRYSEGCVRHVVSTAETRITNQGAFSGLSRSCLRSSRACRSEERRVGKE